jgi:hypothetical protein
MFLRQRHQPKLNVKPIVIMVANRQYLGRCLPRYSAGTW